MALFQKKQFDELAGEQGKYCISIYIPTQRIGENKESWHMLKNQVSGIEKQLTGFNLKRNEIDKYLDPVKEILNDSSFWRHLSDSLIIFRNKEKFITKNLPLEVDEFSLVSDKFYLLPLLDMFNQDNTYFIFLLSLKKNKLFQATQNEISEVFTEDVFPEDVYDSAGKDVEQKSLQSRGEQTGEGFALFHGKGEGKDDKKIERYKYLRDISHAIDDLLEGYSIPLVIASTEDLFSQFHDISSCKNVYPTCVAGNYDNEDILLVHEKANELLVPYFEKVRNEKKKKYLEAPDDLINSITEEVIKEAHAGQIETLFVEKGRIIWGSYNKETGELNIHKEKEPLDNCLLDFTARIVFLKGGQVFIEETGNMPESGAPLNAVLRFSA
jgi:hypothetical protein